MTDGEVGRGNAPMMAVVFDLFGALTDPIVEAKSWALVIRTTEPHF
jgi:hypothetical protein